MPFEGDREITERLGSDNVSDAILPVRQIEAPQPASGKSVRLFLVDGSPGGLVTAEIMNWTGYVTAAPRSHLQLLLGRNELSRTGVYILLGDDPENFGEVKAYIGEGDSVRSRLLDHERKKDFWDQAIVMTSKDSNLTKAHARYLESRLIAMARDAKRAQLVNSTSPPTIPLPEGDQSDMEFFLNQAQIILPVLGVNIFRSAKVTPKRPRGTRSDPLELPTPRPAIEKGTPEQESAQESVVSVQTAPDSPLLALVMKKAGIEATAKMINGKLVVLAGSRIRSNWVAKQSPSSSNGHTYESLRNQLESSGVIVTGDSPGSATFAQDHSFPSPSAAGACVTGRSCNGRTEWKIKGTSTTLGQWQDAQPALP